MIIPWPYIRNILIVVVTPSYAGIIIIYSIINIWFVWPAISFPYRRRSIILLWASYNFPFLLRRLIRILLRRYITVWLCLYRSRSICINSLLCKTVIFPDLWFFFVYSIIINHACTRS